MRENETRIGGNHWGMFSIFEPSAPHPGRGIDQSIVAWRLASMKTGSAAFENPWSVIQRTVCMVTGGSNREHHARLQDSIQPLRSAHERVRFNPNPAAPIPYNREELLRWHCTPDNRNPEERERGIPIIHRRRAMTAGEVRMQLDEERGRRPGYWYPTGHEEVSEIQRRFHNPELSHAVEAARQEIMRRYWSRNVTLEPQEYFERMTQMISEPAPPGYREAIQAAQNAD